LEALPSGSLPLGQVGPNGGVVDDAHVTVTVLSTTETEMEILARVGVFFEEIVAGCSCGDDPMPLGCYAEIEVHMARETGATVFLRSTSD
jgi:hypothetical protein